MKRIAVLGSTGSIGTQTLEIVRTNKDIKITALAAGNNIELLEKQIREFKPSIAAVWNEEKAAELKIKTADLDVEILSGMDGLLAAASWKDSQICCNCDCRYDRNPADDRGDQSRKGYCAGK